MQAAIDERVLICGTGAHHTIGAAPVDLDAVILGNAATTKYDVEDIPNRVIGVK